MDTLKMHSLDGVQRNIELIGKLFPNAITEVKRNGKVEHAIDFDVLRQELSDSIVEGREELTGMLAENSDEPYAEEIAREVLKRNRKKE